MKKVLFVVTVTVFAACSVKKSSEKKVLNSPKLVVGVVVDQMRYDYLTRFASKFSENGFKKLMQEGFNCQEHHFSYMPTYTGPGHASVFTGTTPQTHGIIANDWYNKKLKKYVYCAEDTLVKSVGGDFEGENRSPRNLLVTTLGDQIKLKSNGKGKSIGISIKDRGAILPAGKMANAAFWYRGGTDGLMISSTYYMDDLPNWVREFNTQKLPNKYLNQNWETLLPIAEYTESHGDDSPYEHSIMTGKKPVFPYDLVEGQKEHGLSLLKEVPFGNDYLLDFVKATIKGESLGKDTIMDFLSVSFSSPDYIGHDYGPNSIEIEDTYLRLDQNIADLIAYLNKNVGEGEYVLFLTADHGVAQVPQELKDQGATVGYYNDSTILARVKEELFTKYGDSNLIENYSNYQFFLNHDLIKTKGLKSKEISHLVLVTSLEIPGVKSGLFGTDLSRKYFSNGMNRYVQKGWNMQRSGDVTLIMEPGWLSSRYEHKGGTSHGSPWAYDTHVPLLFFGLGINSGSSSLKKTWVEDIVPTICNLIGVQAPMGSSGTTISEVLK